jgi:phosphoadenosine phosphosulfate reductase
MASIALRARAARLLHGVVRDFPPVAFASSFGVEDMVLLDLIARQRLAIDVLTLDTGRLPAETHALIEEARERYAVRIEAIAPDAGAVDAYVAARGLDGFYGSVEARKACCHVRKVEPLSRALRPYSAWVTGLRRAQAESRAAVDEIGADPAHGIIKANPLAGWSDDDVWSYIREHDVPYNALHDRGYPSIGCEPCTRAVKAGEHPRAGRWWWEREGGRKECGLHEIPVRIEESA